MGLPKKYARMGFKKGWAAYKKIKNKPRSKTPTKRGKRTMTKKRTYRKKAKQAAGFSLNKVAPLLAPIAYGFLRERMSDALNKIPFVQQFPATQFTDEAIMLGAAWGLKKVGLNKGVMGSVLRSGKVIELSRIGETLADMQAKKSGSSNDGW